MKKKNARWYGDRALESGWLVWFGVGDWLWRFGYV
jgi:hypothetical protein